MLQSEKVRFAASPILLIESSGSKAVEDACKHVQFILSQQLGLRTVISNSLKESAFPTLELVEQQQELASRVGAGTVCAVGSEAAIHLGKAIVQDDMDELILFPTSYAAVMASTLQRSLLIDTKEETLVPSKTGVLNQERQHADVTLALPDQPKLNAGEDHATTEAAFAVLGFCLVRELQNLSYNNEILADLEQFVSHVEEDRQEDAAKALQAAVLLIGEDISWGFGRERRDIPLALAASLLPKIFPSSNSMSMMAALVSNLTQDEKTQLEHLKARLVKALGEPLTLVSNQSVDTLMGVVRENQASWNCLDPRKEFLTKCLSSYSLVD